MPDLVRVNGATFNEKSCLFTIAAKTFKSIVSADVSDKLDVEVVYDADRSGAPVGSTAGQYSCETATLSMLYDTYAIVYLPWIGLLNAAAGAPGALGTAEWQFGWQCIEGPLVSTLLAENCRHVGTSRKYENGNGKLVVDITLGGRITVNENGFTLFDRTRSVL